MPVMMAVLADYMALSNWQIPFPLRIGKSTVKRESEDAEERIKEEREGRNDSEAN